MPKKKYSRLELSVPPVSCINICSMFREKNDPILGTFEDFTVHKILFFNQSDKGEIQ